MSMKPPKPFRLSGNDLAFFDVWVSGEGTATGGLKYDSPTLTHQGVPGNLVLMSSFRAFKQSGNHSDVLYDLYLSTHSIDGDPLDVRMGWRFVDTVTGVRYHPTNEGIPVDDGRQKITVRRVRS